MSCRASAVCVFYLSVAAMVLASTAPPRIKVEYIINFLSDVRLTGVVAHDLSFCLPERCREDRLDGVGQPCPQNKVCEIVQVTEIPLQGNGYRYSVRNWLTNNQPHPQLKTTPITFPGASTAEEARENAIKIIRLLIMCHDRSEHSVSESGPRPPADCECE